MALIVQKYGGSSVADAESIRRVAKRIVDARRAGHDVVVAVSAMGDTTDELLDLASQVSPLPAPRELDMLLSSGERISMALLAMAIQACKAKGKYVGICGQGPSDHPELAKWLMEQGIESVSLNPDSVLDTWFFLADRQI